MADTAAEMDVSNNGGWYREGGSDQSHAGHGGGLQSTVESGREGNGQLQNEG